MVEQEPLIAQMRDLALGLRMDTAENYTDNTPERLTAFLDLFDCLDKAAAAPSRSEMLDRVRRMAERPVSVSQRERPKMPAEVRRKLMITAWANMTRHIETTETPPPLAQVQEFLDLWEALDHQLSIGVTVPDAWRDATRIYTTCMISLLGVQCRVSRDYDGTLMLAVPQAGTLYAAGSVTPSKKVFCWYKWARPYLDALVVASEDPALMPGESWR